MTNAVWHFSFAILVFDAAGNNLVKQCKAAIQNLNVGAQIDRKNVFDLVFTR
jgi:hypothetical protein